MAIRAAVLAVVLLGGCQKLTVDQSKVVAPPAGAETAQSLVLAFYGVEGKPDVYWYGGEALDCAGGTGFTDVEGDCVGGDQSEDGALIIVSDRGGAPIHETSLAHELAHFASDRKGEGGDPGHTGHFFAKPDGDVELANGMLAALGM